MTISKKYQELKKDTASQLVMQPTFAAISCGTVKIKNKTYQVQIVLEEDKKKWLGEDIENEY